MFKTIYTYPIWKRPENIKNLGILKKWFVWNCHVQVFRLRRKGGGWQKSSSFFPNKIISARCILKRLEAVPNKLISFWPYITVNFICNALKVKVKLMHSFFTIRALTTQNPQFCMKGHHQHPHHLVHSANHAILVNLKRTMLRLLDSRWGPTKKGKCALHPRHKKWSSLRMRRKSWILLQAGRKRW